MNRYSNPDNIKNSEQDSQIALNATKSSIKTNSGFSSYSRKMKETGSNNCTFVNKNKGKAQAYSASKTKVKPIISSDDK